MNYSSLGFWRVAAFSPEVSLAEPTSNAERVVSLSRKAADDGVSVSLFPELYITGYTCEDLFHTSGLLHQARQGLVRVAKGTADSRQLVVVGAPWRLADGRLYNAAFAFFGGQVVAAVPKVHLPNYGEYYEHRWFVSGAGVDEQIDDPELGNFRFATRQLLKANELMVAIEICEDLWAPIPPSSEHALAGANLILNPSASNELIGKADYRRNLVKMQSASLNCAYLYAGSGPTESTKDIVFIGHMLAAENGVILAESDRLTLDESSLCVEIDTDKLLRERVRSMTFGTAPKPESSRYHTVPLDLQVPLVRLERLYTTHPYVPDDEMEVDAVAKEILALQATGLSRRALSAHSQNLVVGISGGLDSTLALIVCLEAAKQLKWPTTNIRAYSLPGPGTTQNTRSSARKLAEALGVAFSEIPIDDAVRQHLADIDHDPNEHNVVFENAQARERTQILFNLANKYHALTVGTGDMSELALGWCTYNGDHMSSYTVNVSVPKTLVKYLIRWYAAHKVDDRTAAVLQQVMDTTISPELLPPDSSGDIAQATEALVGPYELHDFFLYHYVRNGFAPKKIFALALLAFADKYERETVKTWLRLFFHRFYRQQFKRSCLPPGPKVGSVSLSPRGDWRMPDEATASAIINEIDEF